MCAHPQNVDLYSLFLHPSGLHMQLKLHLALRHPKHAGHFGSFVFQENSKQHKVCCVIYHFNDHVDGHVNGPVELGRKLHEFGFALTLK